MQQRKKLLMQGEANPILREGLQQPIHQLNQQILQTPAARYNDPSYTRVKFLRYADDVVVGVIGPQSLAEQVREELAIFLKEELKLELNQQKTVITHLATEQAHFLGYAFKTASPRWRKRNLQHRGSPHNIVQTTKTTSGNITLLMPLKNLSEKLKKYTANGQPACMNALINQPVDHIIEHYNSVLRGWYNFYQLAENVSQLNYTRYVFRYSLAKTLAHKEGSSVSRIFQKYGKDLSYRKPNGNSVCLFKQPLKQVKTATSMATGMDVLPSWMPRRTQSKLMDNCIICNSPKQIERHHLRHIRKPGEKLKGFTLYMAVINRKQIPVCHLCHRDIHNGKYDGARLAEILDRLQTLNSVAGGSSL